ncbi:uncharacterized protein LOC141697899 [Apium graveolens]|uniref:uncharacterized protein LOC141697899 n=1 Tax=Apium graveolens TaxID=4045 RepID=UPI003D7B9114
MMINAAKRSRSPGNNAPHLTFQALFRTTDESGRTVLELAVEKSNVHAVDIILKQDPAYESGRGSKNHLMQLIYKAIDEKRGGEIVKLLSEAYENGIDTDHKGVLDLILALKGRDNVLVLQLLQSKEKLATFADDEGWTPLHYAVKEQLVSVFELIIKALNNEFVYSHSTPFHVAAENGYNYTMIELMKLWPKSSSAYIDTNKTGRNVLHLAAARKNKKMIQEILVCCPRVHKKQLLEQKDEDDNTPLHLLISNKCYVPEVIKHKGLDLMTKNKKKWTPRDLLYIEDGVTDDQVQIKVALDHAQTIQHGKFWEVWKFWQKGTGTEMDRDIFESIVLPNRRQTKDDLLHKRRNEMMDDSNAKMRKRVETYKDRTNTQIVVAALITTVTFTVGFTMPGGLHQSGEVDEGLVVLSKRTAFNAFMVTDALALLLSTSSLFFYFLQSIYKDHHQVARLNAAATGLNIVSITAMMVTFITGTYVVLYNSPALAITVCIIASLFFILVIVLLIKLVCDRGVKTNAD